MKRHIPPRMLVLTALFAGLTAAGAFLRIPTPWSAFTLQVLFVFLAGAFLGPGYGALSQGIYLLLGFAGLPVFAGGGGPAYLLRPSCGFLLSYIPAAAVVGALLGGSPRPAFGKALLSFLAGLAVIYAVGLPYMALILNACLGLGVGFGEVLRSGMLIFLPFDALKILLAALLVSRLLPRLQTLRPGQQR